MTISQIPSSRYALQAETLNNEVYIAGGYSSGTDSYTDTYYSQLSKYSVNNNDWGELKPMTYARSRFGLANVNGKLYAIGGTNGIVG
jgi:hypothetical protein